MHAVNLREKARECMEGEGKYVRKTYLVLAIGTSAILKTKTLVGSIVTFSYKNGGTGPL